MRQIFAVLALVAGGACASDAPHLNLPAAPACDVPAGARAIHSGFDCGPGWLAVDDTHVYWSEMSLVDGTETVHAGDKCGGATQRLGTAPLGSLASADGQLYGVDEGHLFAVPVDGRAAVAVASGFAFLSAMALDPTDDTAVLGAAQECPMAEGCTPPGSMWRVHRSGGTAEALLGPFANARIYGIAVAPDGYYVLGSMGDEVGGVYHLGRDGPILERLGGPDSMDQMVVDPVTGELFVRATTGIQVRDGSSFRTVWPTAAGAVRSFVLDERYLYAAFTDGHLGRTPRHGGREDVLLQGGHVVAVGLDAAAVYAFDCSLGSGQILQLPR